MCDLLCKTSKFMSNVNVRLFENYFGMDFFMLLKDKVDSGVITFLSWLFF